MSHLETNDKRILQKYHARTTMREQGFDDRAPLCPYCQTKKRQFNRYWICTTCTGKPVRLPSGKNLKRNQRF